VLAASSCENTKPDGAGLVFTRYANAEKSSVWVADADGSDARQIAPDAYNGSLSPDGRRLAYLGPAGDPDALPTLLVRELAGGEPQPVGKAFKYAWSPDGMRLAASNLEALSLFDLSSGKRRKLVSGRVVGGFSFAPPRETPLHTAAGTAAPAANTGATSS
jgi:dipeptidyl aminopeptidase/acylaminoacyl peptidase